MELTDWPEPTAAEKYLQLQELIAAPEATFRTKTEKDLDDGEGDEEADKKEEKKPDKKPDKKDDDTGAGRDQAPKKSAEEIARERAQQRAAIAEQLAQRGINKILGSLGGSGEGAIVDVLRGGDVGADQDDLLSQVDGIGVATGGDSALRGPAGGQGTGEAADISQLRMKGGDVAVKTAGAGKERKVSGKVRKKKPTAVDGTGDLSPQEVAKVVSRRIGAIKGCYERALRRNPTLEGKITVRFTISGSGKVSTARTTLNELSADVGNCIVSAFKRFRFPQPDGGALTVEYPFLFTPSN
jgi:outer membrane biosynthesis protein TonB